MFVTALPILDSKAVPNYYDDCELLTDLKNILQIWNIASLLQWLLTQLVYCQSCI